MSHLLSVEQWITPIEGTTQVRLREPTGEPYDPHAIPGWLGHASLAHLQNADVRITLLFGQRRTAADLGGPGEFEALAQTATLLGDTIRFDDSQGISYGLRRQEAFVDKGIPLFSLNTCRDQQAKATVAAISRALLYRVESALLLQHEFGAFNGDAQALHEDAIQIAALALATAAKGWMALLSVNDALARMPQQEHHVVLSLSPLQLNIERQLTEVLHLPTESRRIGEDQWPNGLLQGELFQAVLAEGGFDAAN